MKKTKRYSRKPQRNKEVAELAYMIKKDVGICVRCEAQWAEEGHVLCGFCLDYNRNKVKNQRRRSNLLVLGGRRA